MTKQGQRNHTGEADRGPRKYHFRSPVITSCLVVIALCIGGYAFSYLKAVLSPLLIALFVFFLTNPIVRQLRAFKFSPSFSYFLVVVLTIGVFSVLGFVIFGSIQEVNARLPAYQQNLGRVVDQFSSPIVHTLEFFGIEAAPRRGNAPAPGREGRAPAPSDDRIESETAREQPPSEGTQGPGAPGPPAKEMSEQEKLVNMLGELFKSGSAELLNRVIGTSLEYLEIALMTVFYLFFILIETQKLPKRIKRGFAFESTQTLMEMGEKIQRSIEQYLRVKTGVSLGLAVTSGLISMLFGLDFWLLWAGFMFLANYVTYVGSMVALIPPIAIAFLQFESLLGAIVLTVLLVANRFFWIDYAEIRLSGQQLNVSPVILLLSIGLFGALWGVIGMVLAVPVVTSVKIALSQFESTEHLASILSED